MITTILRILNKFGLTNENSKNKKTMARELSITDQKVFKRILGEKCDQLYAEALKKCTIMVDSWKTKPPKNKGNAIFNLYDMLEQVNVVTDRIDFNDYDYFRLSRIVATGMLTEEEMTEVSEKGRLRIMRDAEAFRQKYLNQAAKSEMDLAI
ncbi:hypothetical protein HDC92_003505 [Pedobacter sp. AK017]|uniref:hypothetical protein n=1 Tax=Pedobacter sp. AK017 TaxID=2723073 RepID=UPI0016214C83|nr:hypothetical protein [Pedobacter sp. AK017]MBB5439809.1 hypothetical protein [Pedobacter sp. AK017]